MSHMSELQIKVMNMRRHNPNAAKHRFSCLKCRKPFAWCHKCNIFICVKCNPSHGSEDISRYWIEE